MSPALILVAGAALGAGVPGQGPPSAPPSVEALRSELHWQLPFCSVGWAIQDTLSPKAKQVIRRLKAHGPAAKAAIPELIQCLAFWDPARVGPGEDAPAPEVVECLLAIGPAAIPPVVEAWWRSRGNHRRKPVGQRDAALHGGCRKVLLAFGAPAVPPLVRLLDNPDPDDIS